ncbi:MAG: 50S ribosomal protein L3 [Candidatus Margulisiibacteriota bacterium]|jgi:large subunit ribosomal protein L3
MKKVVLGKKLGMTQLITESEIIPVTVVQLEDAQVLRVKNIESDGYESFQVAFGAVKENKCNKPHAGIFKKLEFEIKKYLKEFRLIDNTKYQVGDVIGIDVFEENEKVTVRSKSIGRGFTGTIKRWNFSRGPMSHGSKSHRIPGSIGAGTTPGRVLKNKKMPGHYGNEFVSIKNLLIVKIDKEKKLIFIKGAVPGKKNNLVEIYN